MSEVISSADFPGPYCEELDIKCTDLLNDERLSQRNVFIRNGLVLELINFVKKHRLPIRQVALWLQMISTECNEAILKTLESRINREIIETDKKFKKRKKHSVYKTVDAFKKGYFSSVSVVGSHEYVPVQVASIGISPPSHSSPADIDMQGSLSPSVIGNTPVEIETLGSSPAPVIESCKSSSPPVIGNTPVEIKTLGSSPQPVIESCKSSSPPVIGNTPVEIETLGSSPPPVIESCKSSSPTVIGNTPVEIETLGSSPPPVIESCKSSSPPVIGNTPVEIETLGSSPPPVRICRHSKKVNHMKYEIKRHQKQLSVLKDLVQSEKEALVKLKAVAGHFSVRNVTKRDENARNLRQKFRNQKNLCTKLQNEVENLNKQNKDLNTILSDNESLKHKLSKINAVKAKKTKAQKLACHYKQKIFSYRNKDESSINSFKLQLKKKQDEIEYLQNEVECIKDCSKDFKCETKNSDSSFSDCVRLCVIELFALEISTAKISSAIEVVGKHLFNHQFNKADLPTPTTVRNIVDEGHYLAKHYIATRIVDSENIGICRDGTTRKKEKIVDTTVTCSNGEIMSIGFTKVARETAKVIHSVTEKQFNELADTVKNPEISNTFLADSLHKLSFTMSDRASNEKLANKLLSDWRDSVLSQCGDDREKESVYQFHCMAHVLLGFHRYATLDIKTYEKELTAATGPIGRDQLPMFKFWSNKQTTIERIVYTASGIFGPVGDHLGLRDRWESQCAMKGIKSTIGNYKDNRFNSLFQTAAEVYLHSEDFLEVIKTVPTPNRKILSVEADLKSPTVQTMLRGLTAVFVKVTGPYWWLVTSGSVSYLELHVYVQRLENFLVECAENPTYLFSPEYNWITDETMIIPHLHLYLSKLDTSSPDTDEKMLHEFITIVCKALLKTITKQLVDFLPGGRFSVAPTKTAMKRTKFAQVNNLGCEHHFGDLDSSQRRRPNASLHHHSSVQMLKRNRSQLVSWLTDMSDGEKSLTMKKARQGGINLRKRHLQEDKDVQQEILSQMETGRKAKRRKIDGNDCESGDEYGDDESTLVSLLPNMDNGFTENEYIIVAYQDAWYPGCVVSSKSPENATVNFMTPCKKPGTFMWPSRKDVQVVDKQFVISKKVLPDCCNNGRQWFFPNYLEVNDLFQRYKELFF